MFNIAIHWGIRNLLKVFLPESGNVCSHRHLVMVAYSHWLHFLDFSPLCVFRCVLKLPAWDYVFSYVSFIHLDQSMHSHTGYICLTFLHCAFPNVYSKSLDQRRQSHTGCIFLAIRHRVFSKASSNRLPERRLIHIGCIYLASSTVCFQMSVQSVWIRWYKVELSAFVGLSPVCVFK